MLDNMIWETYKLVMSYVTIGLLVVGTGLIGTVFYWFHRFIKEDQNGNS